ncbi:AraC family transcriptional regulator [uncultured Limosilactobacillus sp.]|uniref:AraC family transcriptional regulator n=1 Tax=uncultured Limosilactobacillus sp. TaxID=2837629 RepID=UPI0025E63201|nr:AraC family transcriptional regulator [uncultured Limosilactobacillus sp.]
MKLKSLHLTSDLYENVSYDEHAIPLVTCIDNFDDYVNRQWTTHWHDGFEMTTVIQGSCQYIINNGLHAEKITLQPGDGIFVNSGILHSVQALVHNTRTAGLVLPPTFFNFKGLDILRRSSVLPVINSGVSEITWQVDNPAELAITNNIKELCQLATDDPDYELHSLELVCRIWRLMVVQFRQDNHHQLSFTPNNQVDRVRVAIQYLHENYQRARVTVDEIANAINISRAECFRSFKAVLYQTPIEYLNDYRMAMAESMLTSSTQTVKEVALRCGFSNPSYFSSEFKKRVGMTPKKYRQTKQKG